jgi:hypothetical protein
LPTAGPVAVVVVAVVVVAVVVVAVVVVGWPVAGGRWPVAGRGRGGRGGRVVVVAGWPGGRRVAVASCCRPVNRPGRLAHCRTCGRAVVCRAARPGEQHVRTPGGHGRSARVSGRGWHGLGWHTAGRAAGRSFAGPRVRVSSTSGRPVGTDAARASAGAGWHGLRCSKFQQQRNLAHALVIPLLLP